MMAKISDENLEKHVINYYKNKSIIVRGMAAPDIIAEFLLPTILYTEVENSEIKTHLIKYQRKLLALRIEPFAAPYILDAVVKSEI